MTLFYQFGATHLNCYIYFSNDLSVLIFDILHQVAVGPNGRANIPSVCTEREIEQATKLIEEADQQFLKAMKPYKRWMDADYNIEEIEESSEFQTPSNIELIKYNEASIKQLMEKKQKAVEEWTDPLSTYIAKYEEAHDLCKNLPQYLQEKMKRFHSRLYTWLMLAKSVKMMYETCKIQCEKAVNAEDMEQFDKKFTAYSREREKFVTHLIFLTNVLQSLPEPTMSSIKALDEKQEKYHLHCTKRMDEAVKRMEAQNKI